MKRLLAGFTLATAIGVANAAAPHDGAVGWIDGDPSSVDAAFASARAAHKPLFLYWGATWCPPCNQVRSTVFNRQDFAERARYFIAIYIDGDSPGAQKLGDRFHVGAYPTMILFSPSGAEITRLPGEVDAERYMQVLTLAMAARPVKAALAAALAADPQVRAGLREDDWRMLAYYSWDTDEERLVADGKLPSTLRALAKACPASLPEIAARLDLRALVAASGQGAAQPPAKGAPAFDRAAALHRLTALLADSRLARENFDLVTSYPADLTPSLTDAASDPRGELAAAWDRTLIALGTDPTVATADRLSVLDGRLQLARLLAPAPAPLPDALRDEVARQVAAVDQGTRDVYARQAVIPYGGYLLAEAGMLDESDTMLKAELARSHSPYYVMLDLAANAKKRGDTAGALDWDQKAYDAAVGPATRLQWGSIYLRALLDDAPQDEARIDRALGSMLRELEPTPETFHDRNRRALERITAAVAKWNRDRAHDAVVARARQQVAGVCSRLPARAPERAVCTGVLAPASRTSSPKA